MRLEPILHCFYASHRCNPAYEAIDFFSEHGPAQNDLSIFGFDVDGARMADQKAQSRADAVN